MLENLMQQTLQKQNSKRTDAMETRTNELQ